MFGSIPKYWKTATMAASGYLGESPLFMIDYLIRLLRVLVLLAVWRMILSHAPDGTMPLAAVLTYTLIAEVFAPQLTPRTNIDSALWEGSIAGRMLQPLNIFGQFSADAAGKWLFELCVFSAPLFVLAPLMGVQPLPANVLAGALFCLSLALGIAVGLALEFIFAALLVILQLPLWAMLQIRSAITTLLSGALLPLALLPPAVGALFAWLPFASTASAPLQIYVGMGDAPRLLALQLAWALALWPLAHWLWQRGRERMISYGG
jgi:ABC-2 type transport system permease protein